MFVFAAQSRQQGSEVKHIPPTECVTTNITQTLEFI